MFLFEYSELLDNSMITLFFEYSEFLDNSMMMLLFEYSEFWTSVIQERCPW